MIVRDAAALSEGLTPVLLSGVLREFVKAPLPNRERMKAYYDGKHAITTRVRPRGMANNRVVVDYPRYITILTSSYLAGAPISYQSNNNDDSLTTITDAFARANIEAVDAEISVNQALYGVGLEVVFMDEQAQPMSAAVDPRRGFVVYDDTVRHKPLFGVLWRARFRLDGSQDGYHADAYTESEVIHYTGDVIDGFVEVGRDVHPFGAVPIVEYWNNADERGDFEPVLSLIDAYDVLQSDRVNDKQQFADSLLVFTGIQTIETSNPDDKRTVGERLRMDKAISLPDDGADVKWLTKSLNESDTQVLSDALRSDIHKMSMAPDLTDQNFSGNTSGVAMRFKLLGLEQLTKTKERWFREGLRQRLRLYAAAHSVLGAALLEADSIQITFTRSLPVNDLEIAQEVSILRGIVPDKILLTRLPYIEDVDAALELLEEQRQADEERNASVFGKYVDANEDGVLGESDADSGDESDSSGRFNKDNQNNGNADKLNKRRG